MTNTKKVTKKDNYNAVLAILSAAEAEGIALESTEITYETLAEFVKHEVELLDAKAVKAAERAAAKKADGDALREKVQGVMTAEVQSIDAIVDAIGDPDVSKNMVTSRLTQLKNLGIVVKDEVSVPTSDGKTRKVSGYRLA